MIISNIKFLASSIAPKPLEVEYWVDITEDPYGGVIKYWNGIDWASLSENIGGISDAPSDGKRYVRSKNKWVEEDKLNNYDLLTKNEAELLYAKKEELPDTSNFITNSVNDLVNYYNKDESYSKLEIDEKITALNSISFSVVDELPSIGNANIIYLVPSSNINLQNEKDEYIWINDRYELIGTTKIDLSDYYTIEEINNTFSTKEEVNNSLNTKVDKEIGKSLISDTEIERLASVNNYNDSQIKNEIESLKQNKVDNSELTNLITKQELAEGLDTKLDKGNYITEIKTINGLSLIGSGNLEIQSESGGILDAPSDGNKYVRLNNEWVTETTIDTSSFALKEELPNMEDYITNTVAEETYAKKTEIPEQYRLPIATSESLGGIKVGAGLAINSETGVLSATGGGIADAVDWNNITSKPETFTPSAHVHVSSDITDLQDKLNDKVNNSDISDMATKTWVSEQGYLTEHLDISQLATKEEMLLKLDISTYNSDKSTFALKSEIPNVNNFITNTVDNLTNYYLKTDTYTKNEINSLIDSITTINISIVNSLPETGEINIIYLVPSTNSSENNVKDEYLWINNQWELIGSTKVDLTGYATLDWVESKDYLTQHQDISNLATKLELALKADSSEIADMLTKTEALSTYLPIGSYLTSVPEEYITESELNSKNYATVTQLNNKADKSSIPTKTSDLINDSGYITSIPSEYITEDELSSKNYATTSQLSNKADISSLSNYLTISNALSTYATKTELTEGLNTKQPIGNYLTEESDPTVPSWAKQATKPTYTASEVGALPSTTTFKTINNESILGSGNITIDTNNAVDITELVNRLMSQETCSDEDYNKLKEYCDNGIIVYYKEDYEGKITYMPLNLYSHGTVISIDIPASGDISVTGVAGNIIICISSNDKSIKQVQLVLYSAEQYGNGLIGSGYKKQTSYSEITGNDTIKKAVGKLEAGLNELQSNSGSINITGIISKYTDFSGGKFEQNDYNILKEYAISGNNIYAYNNDNSAIGIVTIMFYNNMLSIYMYDTISNKNGIPIISYTVLYDLSYTIDILSLPYTNYIDRNIQNGCLYNYVKSIKYSSITKSDTIKTAIGKLEAAIPAKVDSGNGAVTQQISPNKFYKFGICTSLTITLDSEISGIYNEYMFGFTSGSTATSLGLPSTVKWNGGDTPTIEANKTYIVAIVDNIAVIGGA